MAAARKRSQTALASAKTAPAREELLGPPALLSSENAQAYAALESEVRRAIAPADMLEEIWLRDIVDLQWEMLRLRRLKILHLEAAASKGLESLLEHRLDPLERTLLIPGWVTRAPHAVKEVGKHLAAAGLSEDAIAAETLVADLDVFDKLDRLISQTEGRRNAILREIDRHRDAAAARRRQEPIEDAEFSELPQAEKRAP